LKSVVTDSCSWLSNYSDICNLTLFSSSHSFSVQRILVISVVISIIKYIPSSTNSLQTSEPIFSLFLTIDIFSLFFRTNPSLKFIV